MVSYNSVTSLVSAVLFQSFVVLFQSLPLPTPTSPFLESKGQVERTHTNIKVQKKLYTWHIWDEINELKGVTRNILWYNKLTNNNPVCLYTV